MTQNNNSRPKKKTIYSYSGFYLIVLGYIIFITGGYFVYINYSASFLGTRTDATLLSKDSKEGDKYINYYFNYSFKDYYGKEHEGSDLVSKPLYSAVEVGGSFPIYYVPKNPDRRYIPGTKSAMVPAVILIIGFAIIFASTIGFSMYLTSARRDESE